MPTKLTKNLIQQNKYANEIDRLWKLTKNLIQQNKYANEIWSVYSIHMI